MKGLTVFDTNASVNPLVGASADVIEHVYALHARTCAGQRETCRVCPCGGVVLLACATCAHVIFTAHPALVTAGRMCPHGRRVVNLAKFGCVRLDSFPDWADAGCAVPEVVQP